jgi:spermidine synthase
MRQRLRNWIVPGTACVMVIAALLSGCAPKPAARPHAAPVVSNVDFLRKITVDGRTVAYADTTNWRSELKYVAVLDLPMHFFAQPGKVLLAGLGGGSVALNYRHAAWDVEVADPDTARWTLMRTSFGFRDSLVRMIPRTGREVLAGQGSPYDVILVDAVSTDDVPTELLTKEFFALASARLSETGIIAVAVESHGWKDEVVQSLSATLASVFQQVIVLPIVEPPDQFGSIVVLATNTPRNDLLRDPERNLDYSPEWRYGPEYQKAHAWDNHFILPTDVGSVQTDANNGWDRILAALRNAVPHPPKDYAP